jgi:hypothetical protein
MFGRASDRPCPAPKCLNFVPAVPLAPACEVNDVRHRKLSTVPLKGETVELYFVRSGG